MNVESAVICLRSAIDFTSNLYSNAQSLRGGMKCLCELLIGVDMEIIENMINIFQKIVPQVPDAVLSAHGIYYLLMVANEVSLSFEKKKSVLILIRYLIGRLQQRTEFENLIVPVMPLITNLTRYIDNDANSKQLMEISIELVSEVIRLTSNLEDIKNEGPDKTYSNKLMSNLLEMLLIGAHSTGFTALTEKTWFSLMITLRFLLCTPQGLEFALKRGLLEILQDVNKKTTRINNLPEEVYLNTKIIKETIVGLFDKILPEKNLKSPFDNVNRISIMEKYKVLEKLVENVIPYVLEVYEEATSYTNKLYCAQVIHKLCYSPKVCNKLDPNIATSFIIDNLMHKELMIACFGLKILEMFLKEFPKQYFSHFKKRGLFELIRRLHNLLYINYYYNQKIDKSMPIDTDPYYSYFAEVADDLVNTQGDPYVQHKIDISQNNIDRRVVKLRYYIYYKSEELLRVYIDNPKIEKQFYSDKIVSANCKALAEQLTNLLDKGVQANKREWEKVFKKLAETLTDEKRMTNYEIKGTNLVSLIYSALCVMPNEYKNPVKEKVDYASGNVDLYIEKNRINLEQMVIRHKAFASEMCSFSKGQSHPLIELIKRLNEALFYIEDNLSAKSININFFRHRRVNILISYNPTGKINKGYKKTHILTSIIPEYIQNEEELLELHRKYESYALLPLNMNSSMRLSELEELLLDKYKTLNEFIGVSGEYNEDKIIETGSVSVPLEAVDLAPWMSVTHANNCKQVVFLRFYYNGHELTNKEETLCNVVKNYPVLNPDFPEDGKDILFFNLWTIYKSFENRPHIPIKYSGVFVKGFSGYEQCILNLCLNEIDFTIPQLKDKEMLTAIRLLKTIYTSIKLHWSENKAIELAHIKETEFLNPRLELLIKNHVSNSLQVIYSVINPWVIGIVSECPFLLTEKTRMLVFRMIYFSKARSYRYLTSNLRNIPIFDNVRVKSPERTKLEAVRVALLNSGFKFLKDCTKRHEMLEFTFLEEVGSGLGPTLEFYALSAKTLCGIKDFWRPLENGTLFPAPLDPIDPSKGLEILTVDIIERHFEYAGWLCARAIADEHLVDLPFANIFWKLILCKPILLNDIKEIDKSTYNFLVELNELKETKAAILNSKTFSEEKKKSSIQALKFKGGNIEDMMIVFQLQGYNIELKIGGNNEILTIENIEEYIDLNILYTLYATIYKQLNAFRSGFESVFPLQTLKCFKLEELEDIICGSKVSKWKTNVLTEHIIPIQGFDKTSPQYIDFIKYLSELDSKMQRSFLQYTTGSPRLPLGGFADLKPKLTVAKRITVENENPDKFFPSVMTCQNFVKLPEYSSYKILKQKFDYTLHEGQGPFTLS